jgi:sensor histidine kinase YesM
LGEVNNDNLIIIMEDNGTGISHERIQEIFQAADQNKDLSAENTGLGHGLSNVIRRLRHFSGRADVFSIEPVNPNGTRITINIPYREAS